MKKISPNEKAPLDYNRVLEVAQKDFKAVLETCEKEIDDEFVEYLGADYNINLFSLELSEINNSNNTNEYYFIAKYNSVPKYIYVLKLFEDYTVFDNAFYPIK